MIKTSLLKKNFRFKLNYKTFKKFKTVFFNRKIYKHLFFNSESFYRLSINKFLLNKNTSFTNLYFPYNFFFNRNFKTDFISKQKFSYFYSSISSKALKKQIKILSKSLKSLQLSNILHNNTFFLRAFESRIDSILYRTYFALNYKQAKQLVSHKHVRINNLLILNIFSVIKQGDIITFSKNCHTILQKNILHNLKFEFLPKNLEINFKTFQIICIASLKSLLYLNNNFNSLDSFKLDYSINSIFRFFKKL